MTWGLGVPTLCIVKNMYIIYTWLFCIHYSSISVVLHSCIWPTENFVVHIHWKNLHISGPTQFKDQLCKKQLALSRAEEGRGSAPSGGAMQAESSCLGSCWNDVTPWKERQLVRSTVPVSGFLTSVSTNSPLLSMSIISVPYLLLSIHCPYTLKSDSPK